MSADGRVPLGNVLGDREFPSRGVLLTARRLGIGHTAGDRSQVRRAQGSRPAGFYDRGAARANELIRTALTLYRDDLVIATKVGPLLGPDGVPSEQATPRVRTQIVLHAARGLSNARVGCTWTLCAPGGNASPSQACPAWLTASAPDVHPPCQVLGARKAGSEPQPRPAYQGTQPLRDLPEGLFSPSKQPVRQRGVLGKSAPSFRSAFRCLSRDACDTNSTSRTQVPPG